MSDEYICKWTPPYEVFDGEGGYVQTGELIRCKDCRWYVHSEVVCKLHSNNYEPSVQMEADDYCSRAERENLAEVMKKYYKTVADERKEE